jgi:hypothetical protein
MNNLEFLSFSETPNEKHLGIATIRADKRFIFRFKIAQNPKGEGFFSNAPSIKIDDNYYPSFQFDSSYEADEAKKFILSHVKKILQKNTIDDIRPLIMPEIPPQFDLKFEQPPF